MSSWPRLSSIVTRDLLTALDSRPLNVNDEEAQRKFLVEHILRFKPRMKDGTLQTPETLKEHLEKVVRRKARHKNADWRLVWTSGSDIVDATYWKNIRNFPAASQTLNDEKMPRMPGFDMKQDQNLEPGKTSRLQEADGQMNGQSSNNGVRLRPATHGRSKRPAEEISPTQVESASKFAKMAPSSEEDTGFDPKLLVRLQAQDVSSGQQVSKERPNKTKMRPKSAFHEPTGRQHLAHDMSRLPTHKCASEQDQRPQDLQATFTTAKASTGPGSRLPTVGDINAGRMKAPIVDVRSRVPATGLRQDDIARTVRNLWPPEDEHPSTTNARLNERGAALVQLSHAMQRLGSDVHDTSTMWCLDSGFDSNTTAFFVKRPDPELEQLYQSIFGDGPDEHWQWILNGLRGDIPGLQLPPHTVICSMVAAFMVDHVFTKKPPWDIGERIRAVSGPDIEYGEASMDDKGHTLQDLLRQWSFKMHSDPKFENLTIKPYARSLAAVLAETLVPHMAANREEQERTGHALSRKANADTDWRNSLAILIQNALIFKGKADAYGEVVCSYTWCNCGSKLDISKARPLQKGADSGRQVLLTVWPGIELTTKPAPGGITRTEQQVLTTVYTTRRFEKEKDE